ncbi:MAG: M12 family metallo-peptidase [Acidobacteriota bacterium]
MGRSERKTRFLSAFLLLAGFLFATLPVRAAGPPERLFRWIVPLSDRFASPHSAEEASVQVNLHALAHGRALSIELLDGTRVVAKRTGLDRRSTGNYTWRGRIAGAQGRDGDVVLTVSDDLVSGSIFVEKKHYRLTPRGGGEQRLARINSEAFSGCAGAITPPDAPQQDLTTSSVALLPDSSDRFDVLIVYTAAARDAAGGTASIEVISQNAVDLTNTAYANSQVVPRVNLVHLEELPYTETGRMRDDLYWVRDDPGVNELRDLYGADMVALLVHDLSSCGTAFLQSQPGESFAPNAYQVAAWDCAGGNLTLAHEFGHNQGADHNPENATNYPNGAAYAWSYAHYHDGNYRTVLSYSAPCHSGCPRQPYFSNPDIIYNGAPTGVAGDRENFRTINDTAIYVSNFRPAADGCGNGVIEGAEECDSDQFGDATCATFGHSQGTLTCTSGCTIDSSGCGTCGNAQLEADEMCDGTDLGSLTCADFDCSGGGNLTCNTTCDGVDLSACLGCPICDNDGLCDPGENCADCGDCMAGPGPSCGNGVCEIQAGEDCLTCAADCNGRQTAKLALRFCCGNGGQFPVGCADERCDEDNFSCTDRPVGPSCCGDLVCNGFEDSCSCSADCEAAEFPGLSCTSG